MCARVCVCTGIKMIYASLACHPFHNMRGEDSLISHITLPFCSPLQNALRFSSASPSAVELTEHLGTAVIDHL